MTLNDLVHALKAEIGGGDFNDDTTPSNELVADWIVNARTKLIRQLYSARKPITDLIQAFCVPMSIQDASLCCSWTANCDVLRSVERLPKTLIVGERTNGIINVTSLDGLRGTKYELIGTGTASLNSKSKYKINLAFLQDDYLYADSVTIHPSLIDKLLVWVIPENPVDWYELDVCVGANCPDAWDRDFIPSHYVHDLMRIIKADNVAFMKSIPIDHKNNAKDV